MGTEKTGELSSAVAVAFLSGEPVVVGFKSSGELIGTAMVSGGVKLWHGLVIQATYVHRKSPVMVDGYEVLGHDIKVEPMVLCHGASVTINFESKVMPAQRVG